MDFTTLYFSPDGKISNEYDINSNAPITVYSLTELPPFVPLQRRNTLDVFKAQKSISFTINGERCLLSGGDIIFIKPFSLYAPIICDDLCCDAVSLNLNECAKYNSAIARFIPFFADGCYCPITIRSNSELCGQINNAVESIIKKNDELKQSEKLLRLLYDSRQSAKFGLTDNRRAYSVAQMVERVSTPSESPSIAKIAEECGYSEFYTMKLFKKFTGMSIVDYSNKYRITLAKLMLEKTDGAVCEIARKTGFENISYFNRQFKALFGKTPRQCRKDAAIQKNNI